MFGLGTLDYVYMGVVLGSTIWATIRGGVYETVATISWIAAAVAARFVSPWLDKLFQGWAGLSELSLWTLVLSYFIVFFVILIAFGFFNQKLRDKVQQSMLRVTDHTLGVVFGIARGIIVMGLFYFGVLAYYNGKKLPDYVTTARTRPVMQLTAKKMNDWFVPGKHDYIAKDMEMTAASNDIIKNLINPKVEDTKKVEPEKETGYKESERDSLENKLLQIQASAEADMAESVTSD